MTDEEIAKKLRKKDMSVFDNIMVQYNKLLWAVIGNILGSYGSSEDIEDCISDLYIKLLENPKLYNPKKGSLKSFLVRVGKNLAIDKYRKLTKQPVMDLFPPDASIDSDDDLLVSLLSKESRTKLLDAVDNLKEPDREIIIRRYFYNEKVKVISEKMHLQSKEIENKLYQGKLKLKKMLINEEGF